AGLEIRPTIYVAGGIGASAFAIPEGAAVFLGDQSFNVRAFGSPPVIVHARPAGGTDERLANGDARLVGREKVTAQFGDAWQGRRVRTRGEQDGAVLQQSAALMPLGAADHLRRTDHQVARGEVLKAETTRALICRGGNVRSGVNPQFAQGRRD